MVVNVLIFGMIPSLYAVLVSLYLRLQTIE